MGSAGLDDGLDVWGRIQSDTQIFSGAIQGLEVLFIKMGKNGGGAAFGWELQQRSRVQVWIH